MLLVKGCGCGCVCERRRSTFTTFKRVKVAVRPCLDRCQEAVDAKELGLAQHAPRKRWIGLWQFQQTTSHEGQDDGEWLRVAIEEV